VSGLNTEAVIRPTFVSFQITMSIGKIFTLSFGPCQRPYCGCSGFNDDPYEKRKCFDCNHDMIFHIHSNETGFFIVEISNRNLEKPPTRVNKRLFVGETNEPCYPEASKTLRSLLLLKDTATSFSPDETPMVETYVDDDVPYVPNNFPNLSQTDLEIPARRDPWTILKEITDSYRSGNESGLRHHLDQWYVFFNTLSYS
jgi:hypothetical protein